MFSEEKAKQIADNWGEELSDLFLEEGGEYVFNEVFLMGDFRSKLDQQKETAAEHAEAIIGKTEDVLGKADELFSLSGTLLKAAKTSNDVQREVRAQNEEILERVRSNSARISALGEGVNSVGDAVAGVSEAVAAMAELNESSVEDMKKSRTASYLSAAVSMAGLGLAAYSTLKTRSSAQKVDDLLRLHVAKSNSETESDDAATTVH